MKHLAVLISLVALVACQTTGQKDSGGRTMQLSEPKEIEPYEIDLNIPLLLPMRITKATLVIRDNGKSKLNKLYINGNKGYASTSRILLDGWYSRSTYNKINDKKYFKDEVQSFLKANVPDDRIKEIPKAPFSKGKVGGYYVVIKGCFFAKSGYVFRNPRYDNDTGSYDTIFRFRYCEPGVSFDQFSDLFTNLAVVTGKSAMRLALLPKYPKSIYAD